MLTAGTRLGPYEVLSPAGAGGMGEVYRAHDTRLGRDVAVKLLLAGATTDRERLARFEQEARAAAALNHPNIVALHDIGEHDGAPYIVSELLEGETLRERLAGGPLPVRKAIEYGVQIARGLAAAHEKGIVHRDLKPDNVFVTRDGRVKILDFGLAKLTQPEPTLAGLSMLPTTPPDTLPGLVLGTIGYMSPEQVRGLPADQRSDIFAFGAILHEMLAGRRAFEGATPMDTMLAIAKGEAPDLPVVERRIPPALARIVGRCLERDPASRFESMRDLAFSLEAIAAQADTGSSGVMVDPAVAAALAPARRARPIVPWAAAALAIVAALAIGVIHFRETTPTPRTVRFAFTPPGTQSGMFALSPDGRSIAFVANAGEQVQVWVRSMDALDAHPIPGTTDATYPFWSPDGAFIGFFAQGKLKKVALAGGPPQTLCDVASARGGTWNRDGVVLFSAGPTSAIFRVSAAGGTPAAVTKLADNDAGYGHRFPSFLPDGVHFLYTVNSQKAELAGLYVGSLSDSTTMRLLPDATNGVYAATVGVGGYLLFRRETTLMAEPFDPASRRFTGDVFPIAEKVADGGNVGFGAFSVSRDGTLVYRTGAAALNRQIVWVDRTGKRLGTVTPPGAYGNGIALSPDQRKLALAMTGGSQGDIWLQDLDRNVLTRFTFRQGFGMNPVWSPDGSRVVYTMGSPSVSAYDIYQKSAVVNGEDQLLLRGGINAIPLDWSPDATFVVYQQQGRTTGMDLWLLPTTGDHKPIAYLTTPFDETGAQFAPTREGATRWMAYESNESGQTEVYVQSIPTSGAKYQISSGGGQGPKWRADGKELFYVSPDLKLFAVPITLGSSVELGTPQMLFSGASYVDYTPSRDGQRFLVNAPAEGQTAESPVTVVLNWAANLKR